MQTEWRRETWKTYHPHTACSPRDNLSYKRYLCCWQAFCCTWLIQVENFLVSASGYVVLWPRPMFHERILQVKHLMTVCPGLCSPFSRCDSNQEACMISLEVMPLLLEKSKDMFILMFYMLINSLKTILKIFARLLSTSYFIQRWSLLFRSHN